MNYIHFYFGEMTSKETGLESRAYKLPDASSFLEIDLLWVAEINSFDSIRN